MKSRESECKFDADIFRRWRGRNCYLNGKPAEITDRADNWATIKTRDGMVTAAFSWPVVNRIMYKKMEFTS